MILEGAAVRTWRQRAGWSQSALAARMAHTLTAREIAQIETGAAALGVGLSELLPPGDEHRLAWVGEQLQALGGQLAQIAQAHGVPLPAPTRGEVAHGACDGAEAAPWQAMSACAASLWMDPARQQPVCPAGERVTSQQYRPAGDVTQYHDGGAGPYPCTHPGEPRVRVVDLPGGAGV